MENFKKVRTEEAVTEAESPGPFADLAPGAVEMKVKEGSKIRNLLGFAAARMEQPATRTIVFSGCGRAVTKTVTCVEILKRRLAGLHQVTRLRYRSLREVWESRPPPPGCPGPSLSVHKNVPAVSILLSKDALDPGQPGYQPPEPQLDAQPWAPALAPAPPAAPGLKRGPGSPAAEERVEEGENNLSTPTITPSASSDQMNKVPVVKAKATHIIMNSLITKQTQEIIQCFEQRAGLTDAGYTPHKGLTTEEAKYHQGAEAVHKLKLQNGEVTKEDRLTASAQSTPSSTLHSSPKQKPRGWFTHGSSTSLPGLDSSSMDSGNGDRDKPSSEKWSLFGPRTLQKSDSGFSVQSYRGTQKLSLMELIWIQATKIAEDPAAFKPPKMDFPVMEGKKPPPRTHNLKPRDMNVLTPTGF